MVDTFAFVEAGGMDLMHLTGRTAKQFARIEDPILLQREAAAELAQAIIHIRQKFSEPVNGHEEPIPAIERTQPALPASGNASENDVYKYIKARGSAARGEIREAFGLTPTAAGNRVNKLAMKGRIININGRWFINDSPEGNATSAEVYEWLLANGPQTPDEIVDHFQFTRQTLWNRIWYLNDKRMIIKDEINGIIEAVGEPPKPTRKITKEELLTYITENPGQTRRQISAALNLVDQSFKLASDALRKPVKETGLKRVHVKADGGYYPGDGPALSRTERAALGRQAKIESERASEQQGELIDA